MKKLAAWILVFACMLMLALSGCGGHGPLSKIRMVCDGNPRMFTMENEDGDYGVILKDTTKIKFKRDLYKTAWEEIFTIYSVDGGWGWSKDIYLYATVKFGEEAEKPENWEYDKPEGWYYADEIIVKRFDAPEFDPRNAPVAKPVLYLYPQETTNVTAKLSLDGELTCTYPRYDDGWRVTAQPDGTLTDDSGKTYNYLYWEGESQTEYDFSKGFCVPGEDTAAFLEDALAKLGLTRREANEFIVYWLPMMEQNPYNLISFQGEVYTDSAKLEITPKPDSMIRVFMAWKPLEKQKEIEPQELTAPKRDGFTVVEWGGSKVE